MFGLNPMEMIICGVVAVLLFGSRLPSVARSAGKSLTEFRRGMSDLQHDFRESMRESETAVATAAEGTQGRLPGAAGVVHDDSASDTAYDYHDEDYHDGEGQDSEQQEADADSDQEPVDPAAETADPDTDRREATETA